MDRLTVRALMDPAGRRVPLKRWMTATLLAAPFVVPPLAAAAQSSGTTAATVGVQVPDWLIRWSPLISAGDLPRQLPGGEASPPSVLTTPAPRVGPFWTAGNPGALAFDVIDSHAEFLLRTSTTSGDYRRPLDPGTESRRGASAMGWRRLASQGAAIGRVVIERTEQDGGAHADVLVPYTSNPFVVFDTLGDALGATAARLEGAGGWRLGNLGVGLGLGFEARETRSIDSPVPRLNRAAAPGVTAGLSYDLGHPSLQVGVFGRWQQTTQTIQIVTLAEQTRAFVLGGYFEPVPLDLTQEIFLRRLDRQTTAAGVSLGGDAFGVVWTLFAQADRVREGLSPVRSDPPTDEWEADGWAAGLAAQRLLSDDRVLVTLSMRRTTLAGEARRADIADVNFETEERVLEVSGEVRLLPHSGWAGALRLALGRETRARRDLLARVGSDLTHWAPAASLEVARWLPLGLAVAAGAAISQHAPGGTIPAPARMGPVYREYIAPELSLSGTEAAARSGTLTLRWESRSGTALWLRGSVASLSAVESVGQLPSLPAGTRRQRTLMLGVTLAAN